MTRWPRDDHYNHLRVNTFNNFEQLHRYVVEIGGLAITLMDDVAKKFGFKFKAVAREDISERMPQDIIGWSRYHFHRANEFAVPPNSNDVEPWYDLGRHSDA